MATTDEEFEVWFRATIERVRRSARRIVGSDEAAEDIAAEAFARALVRWSKVRNLPHRDAWVLRVASNLAIDEVRRRSRRDRFMVVQRAAVSLPDAADASAEREVLAVAMGRLPRRQREVLALRYLAGLSEPEVAAALDLSPNTVKTHGRRALRAMRNDLGVTWEEPSHAY